MCFSWDLLALYVDCVGLEELAWVLCSLLPVLSRDPSHVSPSLNVNWSQGGSAAWLSSSQNSEYQRLLC